MAWRYYLRSDKKGVLYLAVFLDIFYRKITGWSVGKNMKETLVMEAFMQGYGREKAEDGLIVHTDGGNFRGLLKQHKAIHSNSRKGYPYDNAMMESFYRTLKRELIQNAKFETPEQAQMEIFKYIELYYNTKRMHSALAIFLQYNMRKKMPKNNLTLCLKNVDKSKSYLFQLST